MTAPLRVFVTLGTDHHPFQRLLSWTDAWAAQHSEAEVVIQHGQTGSPAVARGLAFLEHTALVDMMRWASVVVTQGGPGSIVDALACGHRPIVIPRAARRGECVDDHQVRFSEHMALVGRAFIARDESEFCMHLQRAASAPDEYLASHLPSPTGTTALVVDQAINDLVAQARTPPVLRAHRWSGRHHRSSTAP